MDEWESDSIVEKWIKENDKTIMSLPSIEYESHLLISKVRKHYMEYLIKLLSLNYENNQRLLNKNIYLPSAIWRCAKMIEMSATQASMVVHLYRKNITDVISDIKKTTTKGSLYKKLYECLRYAPENEKKVQATLGRSKECNCQCTCSQRKRIKRISNSSFDTSKNIGISNDSFVLNPTDTLLHTTTNISVANHNNVSPKSNIRTSVDAPQSDAELIQQLDKLFQGNENDEDLFDNALCTMDSSEVNDNTVIPTHINNQIVMPIQQEIKDSQKCFDDRLAILSGVLVNTTEPESQDLMNSKVKKLRPSKWLCEEYFQKIKLFELLDQIRDCDRAKYARVKEHLLDLFGDDNDDDGIVSPLEESPDFVTSCKERIAPWVVKILTPYYVQGRIRGKNLFKSLAKHLIRLIYQCSKYPEEYEVQSFIKDFLDSHKMIRCEADFKQFRIENF